MIKVVQALDGAPIAELESDDAGALERKIKAAARLFTTARLGCNPTRESPSSAS